MKLTTFNQDFQDFVTDYRNAEFILSKTDPVKNEHYFVVGESAYLGSFSYEKREKYQSYKTQNW